MQIPYELALGWRYTRAGRATRRNGFISFISGVSMLGIALGVAALIIVLSVMNGFQKDVRDRMLSVVSHIEIFAPLGAALPDPALTRARAELNRYYAAELGEEFVTAGCCYYRDGRDSVAWHGDRIGRSRTEDTMVAIVSLGATRTFALRRRGGGPSLRLPQAHGDLLVMGGSCQRTWEHAVPKTSAPTGPRISIQFRPRDVR